MQDQLLLDFVQHRQLVRVLRHLKGTALRLGPRAHPAELPLGGEVPKLVLLLGNAEPHRESRATRSGAAPGPAEGRPLIHRGPPASGTAPLQSHGRRTSRRAPRAMERSRSPRRAPPPRRFPRAAPPRPAPTCCSSRCPRSPGAPRSACRHRHSRSITSGTSSAPGPGPAWR